LLHTATLAASTKPTCNGWLNCILWPATHRKPLPRDMLCHDPGAINVIVITE